MNMLLWKNSSLCSVIHLTFLGWARGRGWRKISFLSASDFLSPGEGDGGSFCPHHAYCEAANPAHQEAAPIVPTKRKIQKGHNNRTSVSCIPPVSQPNTGQEVCQQQTGLIHWDPMVTEHASVAGELILDTEREFHSGARCRRGK